MVTNNDDNEEWWQWRKVTENGDNEERWQRMVAMKNGDNEERWEGRMVTMNFLISLLYWEKILIINKLNNIRTLQSDYIMFSCDLVRAQLYLWLVTINNKLLI